MVACFYDSSLRELFGARTVFHGRMERQRSVVAVFFFFRPLPVVT